MEDTLRSYRRDCFLRRAEFAPGSVLIHRAAGWRYIPIHPFADDADVLSRLNIAPEDCWSADAWWEVDGDAALVQSCVARMAGRPPGLYARRTDDDRGWVDLLAVIDAPTITRESFEAALSRFAALGFPDGECFRLSRADGLVMVRDLAAPWGVDVDRARRPGSG